MPDTNELPTIGQYISNWLGVRLPTLPLPQTLKNLDKAIGKIILAMGENFESRIKSNTAKTKVTNKIDLDGLFRTEEEKRKLENRVAATTAALKDMGINPITQDATAEIDDDWLNLFARLSEDKSSDDLRILFGKILSGEIQRPGSFSLRTIQLVSTISKQEADNLAALFSYTIAGEVLPFENGENGRPTEKDRLLLEELGIAGHSSIIGGKVFNYDVPPVQPYLLSAIHRGIIIVNNTKKNITVRISGQALTTPARELVRIANPPPTDIEFLKNVVKKMHTDLRREHADDMDNKLLTIHIVATAPAGENKVNYNIIYTHE
jgi:hypothetical protein